MSKEFGIGSALLILCWEVFFGLILICCVCVCVEERERDIYLVYDIVHAIVNNKATILAIKD